MENLLNPIVKKMKDAGQKREDTQGLDLSPSSVSRKQRIKNETKK